MASTAPVEGSSTTMAPVRPLRAASQAICICELMVSTTDEPGILTPAIE